jgi:tRNA_anti-like
MKTYIKVALFIVTFIALSAILAALYFYNLKSTDMTKARPDFIITATALQKAFEKDETKASIGYINKILEVTGKIASVKPAENSVVSISLVTDSDLSSVICTFPAISDPSIFKVGDQITLRGQCSGFLMDVLLNNCALILQKTEK